MTVLKYPNAIERKAGMQFGDTLLLMNGVPIWIRSKLGRHVASELIS